MTFLEQLQAHKGGLVQPMTMPVSSIFYMDYKFGKEEE